MRYVILKWVEYEGKIKPGEWIIVHYTHSFDDFNRMIEKYPLTEGYKHLIDILYLQSHQTLEKVKEFRARSNV